LAIRNPHLKFFASLRLAVVVILGLGLVSAVGTVFEARYNDAEVAQKLVYHSLYMYGVLGLLCVNLVAVMVDRWPWKPHHAGFVLAHVGIIILLLGAWITAKFGLDGSLYFEIGETARYVQVKQNQMVVFGSLGGGRMEPMFESPVDFLSSPPSSERPYVIPLGRDEIKIVQFLPFAFREADVFASPDDNEGPGVRIQLENPNVNLTQWILRDRSKSVQELDLGPAKVVLSKAPLPPSGRNEIILVTRAGRPDLDYVIYNKDRSLRKKGSIRQSETLEPGWMGMKFRLLRYLTHAREIVTYSDAGYATPSTTSAIRLRFRGQEEYWVGLGVPLRLYLEDRAYILSFANRNIDLGFPLTLKEFRMDKYQGTDRAATYESEVEIPDRGRVVISMNEPLKHNGFTFYQASFQRDPSTGRPMASILSVNRDPGRWVKYLGSLLIVFGSCVLFWFKRVKWFRLGSVK
jgi:hypothetical protein